jgi:hypothetical protein
VKANITETTSSPFLEHEHLAVPGHLELESPGKQSGINSFIHSFIHMSIIVLRAL